MIYIYYKHNKIKIMLEQTKNLSITDLRQRFGQHHGKMSRTRRKKEEHHRNVLHFLIIYFSFDYYRLYNYMVVYMFLKCRP